MICTVQRKTRLRLLGVGLVALIALPAHGQTTTIRVRERGWRTPDVASLSSLAARRWETSVVEEGAERRQCQPGQVQSSSDLAWKVAEVSGWREGGALEFAVPQGATRLESFLSVSDDSGDVLLGGWEARRPSARHSDKARFALYLSRSGDFADVALTGAVNVENAWTCVMHGGGGAVFDVRGITVRSNVLGDTEYSQGVVPLGGDRWLHILGFAPARSSEAELVRRSLASLQMRSK